jgi:hypothetical protein
MAVVLKPAQIDFLARAASWKFDIDFKDHIGDPVTYFGDGVDDLDALIIRLSGTFVIPPRVLCDVGKLFSQYIAVGVPDIEALRDRYIEIWGTVAKPPVVEDFKKGTASEI